LTPTQPSRGELDRVPELDGIRALAIWMVLLAHLYFTAGASPQALAWLPAPLRAVLGHGWLGVDLFFVLSGFLITRILRSNRHVDAGTYFRRFYLRRATRILPLYLAVLLALFVAYGLRYAPFFGLCLLLAANLPGLLGVPVPLGAGPFWSLGVEEQFYFVWPWLALWLGRRGLALAALAILLAEPLARATWSGPLELTWFRADGLAMGALVALWFESWDGRKRSALFFAALLAGLALATLAAPSRAVRISEGVCFFGALVTIACAFKGSAWLAPLRSRPAAVTALLSYCIYLIHTQLFVLFAWTAQALHWQGALSAAEWTNARAAFVVISAYALAALSRRFLELPFLRLGRRLAPGD
jgi:peptidoglycan/LPS O-acetylase OafA/YrhL